MKFPIEYVIFYVIGGLCLLYLFGSHFWIEHMTNKDVAKEQATFGSTDEGTADKDDKKFDNPERKPNNGEIFGPLVQPIDPNAPTGLSTTKDGSTATYPIIYGPEHSLAPGQKDTGFSDSSEPPPYDYVPAAEFPAGPLAPSGYLNDFSKILHYN